MFFTKGDLVLTDDVALQNSFYINVLKTDNYDLIEFVDVKKMFLISTASELWLCEVPKFIDHK